MRKNLLNLNNVNSLGCYLILLIRGSLVRAQLGEPHNRLIEKVFTRQAKRLFLCLQIAQIPRMKQCADDCTVSTSELSGNVIIPFNERDSSCTSQLNFIELPFTVTGLSRDIKLLAAAIARSSGAK